ncbi:MAG: ABC transporter ATP-binding protein [Bacteroidetes bacterium]|nr:ABC transporter ATP-binding protein [Bacteroidota bacterium]
MKNIWKIAKYIYPYKKKVWLHVLYTFAGVSFSLFSIGMLIPFLGILFGTQSYVNEPVELSLSIDSLKHYFNYNISLMINQFGKINTLLILSAVMMIGSFIKNGFLYLAMYYLAPIRNGVVQDIRNTLYQKTLELPMSYYSNERKGDLISRMTNDVHQIEWSIISSLEMLFREPITIIVYIASLLVISPQLTLFVVILLPFSGFIIGRIGKSLRKTSSVGQKKLGTIISMMEETLTGLRIIKAFNAEAKTTKKFSTLNQDYTNIMNKIYRRNYLARPLVEFLGTLVVVLIMIYGTYMVLRTGSSLSSQAFIGYLLIFSQILNPAKSFSTAYYNIQRGLASADRTEEILSAENKIVEMPDANQINEFNDSIEFKNVSFRYEKQFVLQDINLKINKGKTIALVGPSGAGKSTMVDLIPRLYEVSEGEILIDGTDIRKLKIKDLRALMGNVNQDAILFNDSFYNNIAFGDREVSNEDVINAAKIANAHEFIIRTEQGYDTNIGDMGNKLSGGQKQRLVIARAVLNNPPVLILDEATSALDTESEKQVQQALSNVMKNRTSIVIAHRLSTVVNADLICVVNDGKIVEQGKHDELIKLQGLYHRLHNLQMFS